VVFLEIQQTGGNARRIDDRVHLDVLVDVLEPLLTKRLELQILSIPRETLVRGALSMCELTAECAGLKESLELVAQ
jgi:hypothetical protein